MLICFIFSVIHCNTKRKSELSEHPGKISSVFYCGCDRMVGIAVTNEPAKSGSCAMRVARCAA